MHIFITLLLIFFSVLHAKSSDKGIVGAESWGKGSVVSEHMGIKWNEAHMELGKFNLKVSIPNYISSQLVADSNGTWISMHGSVEDLGYIVKTTRNPIQGFPKAKEKVLQFIQQFNPESHFIDVDAKKNGAKFVFDLVPRHFGEPFWRFFCTKDRIILLGTDDWDENRRMFFFDSVKLSY